MNNKEFGRTGEKAAAKEYIERGYLIVDTNFMSKRRNEIDIICTDGNYICFVEVKTRSGTAFGEPSDSGNAVKQQRIRLAAQAFLGMHENLCYARLQPRFDVCSVVMPRTDSSEPKILIIENAF